VIWLLLAASLAASREPPVVLDPRLERFLAASQLWQQLLRRVGDYVMGTEATRGATAAGKC
jgi:NAD-dependent oxidoreductase involved in siderophore biosynthesis